LESRAEQCCTTIQARATLEIKAEQVGEENNIHQRRSTLALSDVKLQVLSFGKLTF
jgi:hypothetical protein